MSKVAVLVVRRSESGRHLYCFRILFACVQKGLWLVNTLNSRLESRYVLE